MLDSWISSAAALVVCYVGIAGCAALDAALSGLPAARAQLAIDRKARGARWLLPWLKTPSRILSTLAYARIALILGTGLLSVHTLDQWGVDAPWVLLTPVLGLFILLVCHIAPRYLGRHHPVETATSTLWLVHGLSLVMLPVVWPLTTGARRAARALGFHEEPFWTPDEIGRVLTDAHAQQLGEGGEDLFLSIIEFSDTVIREIMVPRTEMVTIPVVSTREEVDHTVLDAGHSRVPVYDETIDNIIGILHVKDLFLSQLRGSGAQAARFNLRALVRPTFYVPEIMKISELLREFQRRKTHMAIVVDEYGGTAGVVTLEDIIEEIVGEIQDEYDVEEKQFRVLGDNKIIADGRVSIWDLEEALGVEFPSDHDYETLAGFLMARTGSLPETGMVITWNNLRFTVKEANEKRIGMVEIERRPKLEGAA